MSRLKVFLLILVFGTPACIDPEGRTARINPIRAWRLSGDLANSACAATIKHPWFSKTLWLNGLVAVGLLAEENIEKLQGILPQNKYAWIAFGLPIANMILRAYTTQGLSFKPQMPQDTEGEK